MSAIVPDKTTSTMLWTGIQKRDKNCDTAEIFDAILAARPDPLLDEAFVERVLQAMRMVPKVDFPAPPEENADWWQAITRAAIKEINNSG